MIQAVTPAQDGRRDEDRRGDEPMPKTLILVPTDLERRGLVSRLRSHHAVEVCGFGPIAAAARTAGLLAVHRPERVLLAGIAGRLDPLLEIGVAYHFANVACYGVGAGASDAFLTAGQMGWSHWPGDPVDPRATIGDVITLGPSEASKPEGLLLTACAASASAADVSNRLRIFPDAVAEDMEGFGVALACRLAGVPLTIVRGISNTAGDRDTSRWQITAALAAAGALVQQLVEASA
jgi:futalosine hydrolase